jgi:hypothetical protein
MIRRYSGAARAWADEAQPDGGVAGRVPVLPHQPQRDRRRRPPAPGPAVHRHHAVPGRVAHAEEAEHGVEGKRAEALHPYVFDPEARLLEVPPAVLFPPWF